MNETQLYILNAWDATEEMFLGQMTIDSKTNEITAVPKLLEMLSIEGAVVTVDALMTQKEIAKTVVRKGGDYVMALKGNQGNLYEDVELYFSTVHSGMSSARSVEKNLGRVEIRTCTRCSADWLESKGDWEGISNLFRIDSEIDYEGKIKRESRYYITSLKVEASGLLKIARKHWSIESAPQAHKEEKLCA